MSNPNTVLWDSVFTTDPQYTKQFSRSGGFKGTATSPMYLMKRATEKFGPIGIGWGFHELEHLLANDIWCSRVELWYVYDGKRGTIEQWGATQMVQKRSSGEFIDEEAAKKSVTDAVTKCLSYLGFAADIHMGLFDDVKYVNEVKEEKAAERAAEKAEKAASKAPAEPTATHTDSTPSAGPVPVAKGQKPPYDHGKAIAAVSAMKDTLGEEKYYEILNHHGYKKANEIPTRARMEAVYLALKAEAQRAA